MKVIKNNIESEYIVSKSQFLTNIKRVDSVEEAKEFIEEISSKYFDATHNVYSYRVFENGIENIKYSDDGEPQNTAGKPSYDILEKLDVINIVVVITRYFGGIKLGAGGLIRAYAKATKLAIIESGLEEYFEYCEVLLSTDYSNIKKLENILEKYEMHVLWINYNEKVDYKLKIKKEDIDILKELIYVDII